MKLAFYKGTKKGLSGIYNRGVRWIEDGKFSHVEMIFSTGVSASASYMDGGVRFKRIDYSVHPLDWEIVDCPWIDEEKALAIFNTRVGRKYDLKGNVHFILGFIKNNGEKDFCSGVIARCIGLEQAWQYAPNSLYEVVVFINKLYEENNMLKFAVGTDPVEEDESGHGDKPPVKPPANP